LKETPTRQAAAEAAGSAEAGPSHANRAGGLLTIDLDAVAANWHLLAGRAAGAECAAVVKADGYGLGAGAVAARLQREGCRQFFVAHLHEGVALRTHLLRDCAVQVLNGPLPGTAAAFEAHGLTPVLNSLEQIAEWRELAGSLGRPLCCTLQVDSGMSRFGLSAADMDRLAAEPALLDGTGPMLLMSHLACADTPEHPMNERQRQAFEQLRRRLPHLPASLAASSGIFLGPAFHYDMVRPGAALYGVNPTPGAPNPMHPVLRLEGRVVQERWIGAGDSVGYGARFTASGPTRVATVAVGYADGYLRAGGEHGFATWADEPSLRLPVIGRISMDSLALDTTPLGTRTLPPGTPVELIGPHRSLDAAAADAGTIGYELLTDLGRRYHRHYLERHDHGDAS